jgi:predicted Zn-dependent protease
MSHRFQLPSRAACIAVALFAASSVVQPLAAHAAEPTAPKASQQTRYRQAHEAFKAGNWDEARRLLLDLWLEAPSYDVALTLVQVEYQRGNKAAAARYLQYALANAAPTESPEAIEGYKKQLEQLRRSVASATVTVDEPVTCSWRRGVARSPRN